MKDNMKKSKEPFLSINEKFAFGFLLSILILMQLIYWLQDIDSFFHFILQIILVASLSILVITFIISFFVSAAKKTSKASAYIGEKGNVTKSKLWGFHVDWKQNETLSLSHGSIYIIYNLDSAIYDFKVIPNGNFKYKFKSYSNNTVLGFYRSNDRETLLPCSFKLTVAKKRSRWQKEIIKFWNIIRSWLPFSQ